MFDNYCLFIMNYGEIKRLNNFILPHLLPWFHLEKVEESVHSIAISLILDGISISFSFLVSAVCVTWSIVFWIHARVFSIRFRIFDVAFRRQEIVEKGLSNLLRLAIGVNLHKFPNGFFSIHFRTTSECMLFQDSEKEHARWAMRIHFAAWYEKLC